MPFVRPKSVPIPTVWHRFERIKDGVVRKFYVQDATEDMYPFLIDHMAEVFIKAEPMCKYLDISSEPESVLGMELLWHNIVDGQMVLVCFEEDPDKPGNPLKFVGCNMTYVSDAEDEETMEIIGEKWKIVYDVVDYCVREGNKIMKPERYMGAMGLSVKKDYQGMSIGKEILEARTGICKACNIGITVTTFTNISSQKVALKANFKDILEISYEELEKINPRFKFNIDSTKTVRQMYKNIL